MKFLKNIFIAILFLLAITFSLKNNGMVTISYYLQEAPLDIPLYLLVFISVIFGIFVGGVEGLIEKIRNNRAIRRLEKEIESKEKELTSLRNLPITESKMPAKNTESEEAFLNEA